MKKFRSNIRSLAEGGSVLCVVGARPNFMKIAPILRAFSAHQPPIKTLLVHTGQHYDKGMSEQFFSDLCLRRPDENLGVGSGTHSAQTAEVMQRFEPIVDACNPSCVLVVGDVNSTLACALVAAKKGIPLVHVEAGLRSYDRSMPEEINRILTDQISDRLYTTERTAEANLVKEGIPPENIFFSGNVMVDSVVYGRTNASSVGDILRSSNMDPLALQSARGYGVVTMHRPANVDQSETLSSLLRVLAEVATMLPLAIALHPRTRCNIDRFNLGGLIDPATTVLLPPLGYLQMLGLVAGSALVLTDSGGLQEETTALGVPCLTLRGNTERPITVEQGSNLLVGCDRDITLGAVLEILAGRGKRGRIPEFWDGHAAERIAADLYQWLTNTSISADSRSLDHLE